MKIINKTDYNSVELLRIFNECELLIKQANAKKVIVKYHRNIFNKKIDYVGGYAVVGGSLIVIKLPENDKWVMNSNIGELQHKSQLIATVYIHELGHIMRVKHNVGMTIEWMFVKQIRANFNDKLFNIEKIVNKS